MRNSREIDRRLQSQHCADALVGSLQSYIPAFSSQYGIEIRRLSVYHYHLIRKKVIALLGSMFLVWIIQGSVHEMNLEILVALSIWSISKPKWQSQRTKTLDRLAHLKRLLPLKEKVEIWYSKRFGKALINPSKTMHRQQRPTLLPEYCAWYTRFMLKRILIQALQRLLRPGLQSATDSLRPAISQILW